MLEAGAFRLAFSDRASFPQCGTKGSRCLHRKNLQVCAKQEQERLTDQAHNPSRSSDESANALPIAFVLGLYLPVGHEFDFVT